MVPIFQVIVKCSCGGVGVAESSGSASLLLYRLVLEEQRPGTDYAEDVGKEKF